MAAPLFNKLSPEYRAAHDQFFEMTNPGNIRSNMRHLDEMVDLAEKVDHILNHANPIWDTWDSQWGDRARAIEARQWNLDRLSHVKQRLGHAIECKRNYYEHTFMGKITKLILRLFCVWNNGHTASIRKAEDFLLRYDSRFPVVKIEGETHKSLCFWPLVTAAWVRENLSVRNFYNYDSPRAIEVRGGSNDDMPRFMVAVT